MCVCLCVVRNCIPGSSVLEMIAAFEKASGKQVPYKVRVHTCVSTSNLTGMGAL